MLNTRDLERYLDKMPSFYGVFSIDRLPFVLLPRPSSLIINLDPSYKPGSHWVCCIFKEKSAIYFDSFGRYPPPMVETFIERNEKNWMSSEKIYQSERSMLCGYYCI